MHDNDSCICSSVCDSNVAVFLLNKWLNFTLTKVGAKYIARTHK